MLIDFLFHLIKTYATQVVNDEVNVDQFVQDFNPRIFNQADVPTWKDSVKACVGDGMIESDVNCLNKIIINFFYSEQVSYRM